MGVSPLIRVSSYCGSRRSMIYLHKILPVPFLPIGATLILMLTGLLTGGIWLCWAGFLLLWVGSTPLVGRVAMRAVEGWQVRSGGG